MAAKPPVFGIDLGTTMTYPAYIALDTGRPTLPSTKDGIIEVPSVVRFEEEKTVVGWKSLRGWPLYTENTFGRVKPQFNDPEFTLGEHTPVAFNAAILSKVAEEIKTAFPEFDGRAVITVPAYSGHYYRQLVQESARKVGLEPVKLLSEPVAAATAFSLESSGVEGIGCAIDVGGGTTDISVLEHRSDRQGEAAGEVLANYGDLNLGGKDIDELILQWWAERWIEAHGSNPLEDPRVLADWTERAENAKKDLSRETEVELQLNAAGKFMEAVITREEFERRIADFMDKVVACAEEALKQANMEPQDVDFVVPVGGTSLVPLFQQRMEELFNREIEYVLDPKFAVVYGAAFVGGQIAGYGLRNPYGEPLLEGMIEDVTANGLGVKAIDPETMEPYNHKLIANNTKLPAEGEDVFRPVEDDVPYVTLTIYEGDSKDLDECEQLVEGYKLQIPNPRQSKNVPITVKLIINTDGVIEIEATEPSGARLHETLRHPKIIQHVK